MGSELHLLPCPFCGGPARYNEVLLPVTKTIHAINCGDDCYNVEQHDSNKAKAFEKWNTRHAMPDSITIPLAEYEGLRKYKEYIDGALWQFVSLDEWLRAAIKEQEG